MELFMKIISSLFYTLTIGKTDFILGKVVLYKKSVFLVCKRTILVSINVTNWKVNTDTLTWKKSTMESADQEVTTTVRISVLFTLARTAIRSRCGLVTRKHATEINMLRYTRLDRAFQTKYWSSANCWSCL